MEMWCSSPLEFMDRFTLTEWLIDGKQKETFSWGSWVEKRSLLKGCSARDQACDSTQEQKNHPCCLSCISFLSDSFFFLYLEINVCFLIFTRRWKMIYWGKGTLSDPILRVDFPSCWSLVSAHPVCGLGCLKTDYSRSCRAIWGSGNLWTGSTLIKLFLLECASV